MVTNGRRGPGDQNILIKSNKLKQNGVDFSQLNIVVVLTTNVCQTLFLF